MNLAQHAALGVIRFSCLWGPVMTGAHTAIGEEFSNLPGTIGCLFLVIPQHLYSIHLAEQPEDSTMQLADHIKVKCLGQWLSPM